MIPPPREVTTPFPNFPLCAFLGILLSLLLILLGSKVRVLLSPVDSVL